MRCSGVMCRVVGETGCRVVSCREVPCRVVRCCGGNWLSCRVVLCSAVEWSGVPCCGVLESLSNLQSPPRNLSADKDQSFRCPWIVACSSKLPIYSNQSLVRVVANDVSCSGHGSISVRFFVHPFTTNRLKMPHLICSVAVIFPSC